MKFSSVYITYLLCSLLIACGSAKQLTTKPSSEEQKTTAENGKSASKHDKLKAEEFFIEAIKEKELDNIENASRLYLESYKLDKNNDAALYELAMIYVQFGQWNEAQEMTKKALFIDPENKWYLELYADILTHNKEYKEAAKNLDKLIENYPENLDYYFEQANLFILLNKPEDAIQTLDKIESRLGKNRMVSARKASLYKAMGKTDKAMAEIESLVESDPDDASNYLLLAQEYVNTGNHDKAYEVYMKIIKNDPLNADAHVALAEYYLNNGNKERYNEEIRLLFQNPRFDIDWKVNRLRNYFFMLEKDPSIRQEAMKLCEILVETHPNDAKAYATYGDYLFDSKDYEKAGKAYKETLKYNDGIFEIWERLFMINYNLNDFDQLLKNTDAALELFPNQPLVYWYKATALLRQEKYEQAIETLETGTGLYVENKKLLASMYADKAEAHYQLKQYKESDLDFEKSLNLDPENAFVLNNFSYYLSVRNEKLDKALKMIDKAVKVMPDVESFEDTYAWVLFKLGNFELAKTWIENAINHSESPSAELLEHYGDILFKLGETNQAVENWKKAKEAGTASGLIDKKINARQYYE